VDALILARCRRVARHPRSDWRRLGVRRRGRNAAVLWAPVVLAAWLVEFNPEITAG